MVLAVLVSRPDCLVLGKQQTLCILDGYTSKIVNLSLTSVLMFSVSELGKLTFSKTYFLLEGN
jgi:hypothetical protein